MSLRGILVYVRFRQVVAEIRMLGLYNLIVAATFFFLAYISFKLQQEIHTAISINIVLGMLCLMLHAARNDKNFVHLNTLNPHGEMFLEYLFITIPFSFGLFVTNHWYLFVLLNMFLFGITFIRYSYERRTYFRKISRIIHPDLFEILSGTRKNVIYMIILYVLAAGLSWMKIVPLVFLWLLIVSVVSFYEECESLTVLREGNLSPRVFIMRKYRGNLVFILKVIFPVLLINSLVNPEYFMLNSLFLLIPLSLITFALGIKYSHYRPSIRNSGQRIMTSIVSAGTLIPFLLPVPVVLSVIYYYKAKKNLNQFLYDSN